MKTVKSTKPTFGAPPPPPQKGQNLTLLFFFEINKTKDLKKTTLKIFSIFFFFRCFFYLFLFFLGCFRSRFTATLLEIRRWLFYKKDRKCKKSVHLFQRFSIFEAVWRSRNLERVYILSTKAVLQPPCRR